MEKRNVFIIGSKGIPSAYGGYETFVDKLTKYHKENKQIKYHVACQGDKDFVYNNARCYCIKVPNIGPIKAIYYDIAALRDCIKYIKANRIEDPIVYILACRIGPFMKHYTQKIHKLSGKVFINPDGHEWMRKKWSKPVRKYWKYSQKLMVKSSDLIICDSRNIEEYIKKEYGDVKTIFIPYGTECRQSVKQKEKYLAWCKSKNLTPNNYYLVVGRFVPENNYETMIEEFLKSKTTKDLAIITNVNKRFFNKLNDKTGFKKDKRIKFVGTVYDKELLMKIREGAYGYLHGHSVGGTNPSLLEALSSTDLNLLLNVSFNKEVGGKGALYWNKQPSNLKSLIEKADGMEKQERKNLGTRAKKRMKELYSWEDVAKKYLDVFLKEG